MKKLRTFYRKLKEKANTLYDLYLIEKAIMLERLLETMPKNHPMWTSFWGKAWWLSLELQERNLDIYQDNEGNLFGVIVYSN